MTIVRPVRNAALLGISMPSWMAATIPFLALLAFGARAADDWIDELPSVTTVAHAATEELKVTTANWKFDGRGIALKDDDDLAAVTLVGTLVLMRKIMLYKYNQEPALSREREAKLRSIVAAYLEAELVIGRATGNRRGYLTTAHRCRNIDCYRRWFANDISNVFIPAEYRKRILKRLFPCGERAAELDQLAQSYGLRAPSLPSPAVTLAIAPEIAGVGPSGCATYSGDANRNGLCDDWELQPATAATAFRSSGEGCTLLSLTQVRMAQGGGLKVWIAPKTATPGERVRFRVMRAANAKGDENAQLIWEREARIESDGDPAAPLHAIVAQGEKLIPDQERAFLRVDAVSVRSRGPVQCEQPLVIWAPRQKAPIPSGLHGPHGKGSADAAKRGTDGGIIAPGRGADLAVNATGLLALKLTGTNEAGFLILQDTRAPGRYYTTPPVPASPPANPAENATVTNGDYSSSLRRAFAGSCEETTNFNIAAWVHTHPTQYEGVVWFNDNFSMQDFNFAVDLRRYPEVVFASDLRIGNDFEGTYIVVARDRCIRSFTSQFYDDKDEFTSAEIGQVEKFLGEPDFVHKARQTLWATFTELGMVALSEHYRRFQQRQREVGCY